MAALAQAGHPSGCTAVLHFPFGPTGPTEAAHIEFVANLPTFCEARRRALGTLALKLVTVAWRLAPPSGRAIPAQRLQHIRTAAVAKKGFPDFTTFPLEGSAAAAVTMTDNEKRKAEEALEGGPAKKAAPSDKPLSVNPKRVQQLRKGAAQGDGPVIYWCGAAGCAAATQTVDSFVPINVLFALSTKGNHTSCSQCMLPTSFPLHLPQDVAGPAGAGQLGAAARGGRGLQARRARRSGLQPGELLISLLVPGGGRG